MCRTRRQPGASACTPVTKVGSHPSATQSQMLWYSCFSRCSAGARQGTRPQPSLTILLQRAALVPATRHPLQLGTGLQAADLADVRAAARRGGSKHMRLLAQHSVGENPYSRAPLHAAMAGLAQRPDAGGALLLDQPLAKLHPASWCAAALEHPRGAGCLCRTTLSETSWRFDTNS